jgi:hypothetical protein
MANRPTRKHRRPRYGFSSWSTLHCNKQQDAELMIDFHRIQMLSQWSPFDSPSDHSFQQVKIAQMAKEVRQKWYSS